MAVEMVTCYRTTDGTTFDTEEDAVDYESRGSRIESLAEHLFNNCELIGYKSDAYEMAKWFVDRYNFEEKEHA